MLIMAIKIISSQARITIDGTAALVVCINTNDQSRVQVEQQPIGPIDWQNGYTLDLY